MSFSHACVLNLANIARDSHINRKTVENYLHILEDLLLGFRIEVFVALLVNLDKILEPRKETFAA
jgi:predicted AAA+ superfamily ATPase